MADEVTLGQVLHEFRDTSKRTEATMERMISTVGDSVRSTDSLTSYLKAQGGMRTDEKESTRNHAWPIATIAAVLLALGSLASQANNHLSEKEAMRAIYTTERNLLTDQHSQERHSSQKREIDRLQAALDQVIVWESDHDLRVMGLNSTQNEWIRLHEKEKKP